ncbi:hypothetical protein [Allorhodopirellula solitaria]|uniref:AsmA-like C-terminal domain-containing protein n=1 Tax=Allorhodopirellula solitaria TaxID=2527987 RepID=A0A5C5XWV7_9BACT|nr:hypothetical protein [Allorhodopirellula solitaria]TWT67440.1 hypothetical protein CA85_22910 [Allorhodopirellula solitaria]
MTSSESDSRPHAGRNRLKTLLVVVLICLATLVVIRTIGPQTLGEQARRIFESQLAEHYVDWNVSIGRGVFRPGIGLQFENIRLSPRTSFSAATDSQHSRVAILRDTILQSWQAEPAVAIKRITVFSDIDIQELLDRRNPLKTRRVVIDGVTADASLQSDGEFSLAGLWPPPKLGPTCPLIELRDVGLNVTIEAKDAAKDDASADLQDGGGRRDIAASTSTAPLQFHWSEIRIENTPDRFGVGDGSRRVTFRGSSDLYRHCDMQFSQMLRDESVVQTLVQSRVADLRLSDELYARMETWLPIRLPADAQFSVAGDLDVQVQLGTLSSGDVPAQPHTLDYDIDYVIRQGGYADKRLPDRIEQLHGRVHLTPTKLELFPTEAKFGSATCQVQGSSDIEVAVIDPASTTSSYLKPLHQRPEVFSIAIGEFHLTASLSNSRFQMGTKNLQLNEGLRRSLPARSALIFDRFRPAGYVDMAAQWAHPDPFNGQPWGIQADVQCKGVEVRFDKFPYPVEKLYGKIQIADDRVIAQHLTGVAGGRPIHCRFDVPRKVNPGADTSPEKTIVIQSDGAIAINNALLSALSPRVLPASGEMAADSEPTGLESFVRSLQPRGAIELASATISTNAAGVTSRQIDLRVIGGTLRYEKFAYPLYNVAGRIQVEDDLVRLIGFTGNNAGAAKIACDGLYQMPREQAPSELNLRFRVADLAMDHSLRVSLPESSRSAWDALSPAGTLDKLDVQIRQSGTSPIALSLDASHQTESRANPNPLSIRPKAIPYRVDIVGGKVGLHDGVIRIEDLRGRHDASRLIADGVCQAEPSGQWLLSLDLQSGSRLIPDEEFIAAMPDQMSWAMRGLDLRGPLGLRGVTNILLPQDENTSPVIEWDLALQLEGNRIADVGPVHSLRGEIMIRGIKDGELVRAGGEVAIDSLHAYGLQVTSLTGPFSIVGEELRLGTLASDVDPISGMQLNIPGEIRGGADGEPSRPPISGTMFDGQLDVSGILAMSSGDFDVGVSMGNAQLATILAEMGQTRSGITGRFDMNSRLDGRLGDSDLLKGAGTARVSGANMYELPMLVQFFNLLRITPTEDVAFTDAQTEFAIFGEDVNFNRLSLWGDLIALDGSGTLTRLEHLDLTFNTKVSPTNLFSKVISPLRDNRYTFFTVEVDGPISGPTIQRRTLSGVSQTLESWFPSMIRSTTAETPTPTRR